MSATIWFGKGERLTMLPTSDTTTEVRVRDCDCGHAKRDHIYEEGACRPGFVCAAACGEYNPVHTITLDIEPEYLAELCIGTKTFEVREVRDRDFRVGDTLRFVHDRHAYAFEVTYLLEGGQYGIAPGYVVMSVEQR